MTGNVLQLRQALTAEQATAAIRRAVKTSQVRWYLDGLVGMEGRSVSNIIVMTALAQASVLQDPVWDPDFNDWVVELRRSASGRRLDVRVAIDPDLRRVSVIASF